MLLNSTHERGVVHGAPTESRRTVMNVSADANWISAGTLYGTERIGPGKRHTLPFSSPSLVIGLGDDPRGCVEMAAFGEDVMRPFGARSMLPPSVYPWVNYAVCKSSSVQGLVVTVLARVISKVAGSSPTTTKSMLLRP